MAAGPSKEPDTERNTVGVFSTVDPQERRKTVIFYVDEKEKREIEAKKMLTSAKDKSQGYIDEPGMLDTASGTTAEKPQNGQESGIYWIDGPEMKDTACGTTEPLSPEELQDTLKTVIYYVDEKLTKDGSGSVNVFSTEKSTQCGKWLALKKAVDRDRKLRNRVMKHVEELLPNGGKENQEQLTPEQERALSESRDALSSVQVVDLAMKFERLNHCKWKV